MSEEWFDVHSWGGVLQVTRDGKVRRTFSRRKLATSVNKSLGYRMVYVTHQGVKYALYLHRILDQTFIPNPLFKLEINHIDGDRSNCSLDNLEWCTRKENIKHAHDTGLVPPSRIGPGEKCPAAKLNNSVVWEIKDALKLGITHIEIARKYGVCKSTIGHIARGSTWAHI